MAFRDQVAIITGGASGIGRALAEELSRRVALVAVVGLSAALRAEAEGLGVRVSVVCPGSVETAIFENAIGVKFKKGELLERLPLRLMPAEAAARAILRGVERNQAMIVFPSSARPPCRLHR